MNNQRSVLPAILVAITLVSFACTTDMKPALEAHQAGRFGEAAQKASDTVGIKVGDEGVELLKVQYDRDAMWAGLEAGMICIDAGHVPDGMRYLRCVDEQAEELATAESAYLHNFFDTESWSFGQFLEDVGQFLMGADQTTYLPQAHEQILMRSYLALGRLLTGAPGAESDARQAQRLQDFVRGEQRINRGQVHFKWQGWMEESIRDRLEDGQEFTFRLADVLGGGEFDKAKAQLAAVIRQAEASRAADPRVGFASVIAWASYMRSGQVSEALNAATTLRDVSDAAETARRMEIATRQQLAEWVLVIVDAGRGPARRSFDIKFPVYFPPYEPVVFRGVYPDLEFRTEGRPVSISVVSGGRTDKPALVGSIDALTAKNFRARELELWWLPTFRAATRVASSFAAQAREKDSRKWKWSAGESILAELEQPDLRIWSTLPAEQYAALIARPKDGIVRVDMKAKDGSAGTVELAVPEGRSIAFIRAFTPQLCVSKVAPLTVGE